MIIPVRCFSCGKLIGDETYKKYLTKVNAYKHEDNKSGADARIARGELPTAEFRAMKDLEINRICCRRMVLTHVDLFDTLT